MYFLTDGTVTLIKPANSVGVMPLFVTRSPIVSESSDVISKNLFADLSLMSITYFDGEGTIISETGCLGFLNSSNLWNRSWQNLQLPLWVIKAPYVPKFAVRYSQESMVVTWKSCSWVALKLLEYGTVCLGTDGVVPDVHDTRDNSKSMLVFFIIYFVGEYDNLILVVRLPSPSTSFWTVRVGQTNNPRACFTVVTQPTASNSEISLGI